MTRTASSPLPIAFVLGTRPEVIKCAPLISALKNSEAFKPVVVFSGQHKELAEQVFETFDITPDFDLKLMKENQSPAILLGSAIQALEEVLKKINADACIVQGDTTTALAGAISAFHLKIPVIHLEAGLRTHTPYSPFPEEMNRSLISKIAEIHLCPTKLSAKNIEQEGIKKNIHITGNTVVDAALEISKKLDSDSPLICNELKEIISAHEKVVLITGHRRENFNTPMENLCTAILELASKHPKTGFIYPVHPNPNVKGVIEAWLKDKENIFVIKPLDYSNLIHLIKISSLIITDSGGIQEEAPLFGTPLLVTRESTERPEAISCGVATLCNLKQPSELIAHAARLLEKNIKLEVENPFGDGQASERILDILAKHFL